jgi:hypothetical protein
VDQHAYSDNDYKRNETYYHLVSSFYSLPVRPAAGLKYFVDAGLSAKRVGNNTFDRGVAFYRYISTRAISIDTMAVSFPAEIETVFLEMANQITPVD